MAMVLPCQGEGLPGLEAWGRHPNGQEAQDTGLTTSTAPFPSMKC